MSAYKKIATQYRNAESLEKALKAIFGSDVQISQDRRQNSLRIPNDWGHKHDAGAFVISRDVLRDHLKKNGQWHSVYGALGFSFNGTGYDAVLDDYNGVTEPILKAIKQQYALAEIRRQAVKNGYTVQPKKSDDGTIRLVLVK